jgi:hypothetical protein
VENITFSIILSLIFMQVCCYFSRQKSGENVNITKARSTQHPLLAAECHHLEGEIARASETYGLAIASVREHKFVQNEAVGKLPLDIDTE